MYTRCVLLYTHSSILKIVNSTAVWHHVEGKHGRCIHFAHSTKPVVYFFTAASAPKAKTQTNNHANTQKYYWEYAGNLQPRATCLVASRNQQQRLRASCTSILVYKIKAMMSIQHPWCSRHASARQPIGSKFDSLLGPTAVFFFKGSVRASHLSGNSWFTFLRRSGVLGLQNFQNLVSTTKN